MSNLMGPIKTALALSIARPSYAIKLLEPILQRYSSHSPMGASSTAQRKKVTLPVLNSMYKNKEPITVLTAHDFPSAYVADQSGMDMLLVGDSLAMVALGMEDTSEVTLDDMVLHCRSVSRGTKSAFTVGRPVRH